MSSRSRAATRAMNATFRKFGNIMQYNGREILYMEDMDLSFERGANKVVKVRVWELNLLDHELNELSFKAHTVGIGRNMYRIISFEWLGNDDEEIALILEGDGFMK